MISFQNQPPASICVPWCIRFRTGRVRNAKSEGRWRRCRTQLSKLPLIKYASLLSFPFSGSLFDPLWSLSRASRTIVISSDSSSPSKSGFSLPKTGQCRDLWLVSSSILWLFISSVVLVIDLVAIKYNVLFYSRFEDQARFLWSLTEFRSSFTLLWKQAREIFLAVAGMCYSSKESFPRPCPASGKRKILCKHRRNRDLLQST